MYESQYKAIEKHIDSDDKRARVVFDDTLNKNHWVLVNGSTTKDYRRAKKHAENVAAVMRGEL